MKTSSYFGACERESPEKIFYRKFLEILLDSLLENTRPAGSNWPQPLNMALLPIIHVKEPLVLACNINYIVVNESLSRKTKNI
jgi:hypothetical protein